MQYNQVDSSINFRTVKSKDEEGNLVETKRESIKLNIPVPGNEAIIALIEAGTAENATEAAKNNLQLVHDALVAFGEALQRLCVVDAGGGGDGFHAGFSGVAAATPAVGWWPQNPI